MKLIKQFLNVSSLLITVASATLQNDIDDLASNMCPSHSQSIAYQNAETHALLPTVKVVAMMMNYNWFNDANFSISLDVVAFNDQIGTKRIEFERNNFTHESLKQDFLRRDFTFATYASNAVGAPSIGHVTITETKTKKFGVFFDILSVGVAKEYEGRGLALKSLDAVLEFLDHNSLLGCNKLSILPVSTNIKIGLIYGRQGFWPYIKNIPALQLMPMSLIDTSEFFYDKVEYIDSVTPENSFAEYPIMLRFAGAVTLPLRGADTEQEILTKLQQII